MGCCLFVVGKVLNGEILKLKNLFFFEVKVFLFRFNSNKNKKNKKEDINERENSNHYLKKHLKSKK